METLAMVIAIAMIVLNIIGIVYLGIKLEHFILVPLAYIIGLIIIGNINENACMIVAFIVAAITLIFLIVKVVRAIKEKMLKDGLFKAVKMHDKEMVEKMLYKGAWVNNVDYKEHRSPLQIAVENGDKEMVSLLIDKGADVNLDYGMKRPLDLAKDEEIIAILKSHGAKTEKEQNMLNENLIDAINHHDISNAESLISQGADVNVVLPTPGFGDAEGVTPLMLAVHVNDIEMVKLFVKKGADIEKKVYLGTHQYQLLYTDALEFAKGRNFIDIANFLEHPW